MADRVFTCAECRANARFVAGRGPAAADLERARLIPGVRRYPSFVPPEPYVETTIR